MLIQRAVLLDGTATDIRVDEQIVEVGELTPHRASRCSTPPAGRSSLACTTTMSTFARPPPP